MARRMYSIDQISGSNVTFVAGDGINIEENKVDKSVTITLSLYQHNLNIYSSDDSIHAYMTIYSTYYEPVTDKISLSEYLLSLSENEMPATGTAENHTKLIYSIQSDGSLHYTDLQGNEGIYIDDYTVIDSVVPIGV